MSKGIEVTVPEAPNREETQEVGGVPKGGAGRPPVPTAAFPEDMLPMLIQFLKDNSQIKAVPKLVDVNLCLCYSKLCISILQLKL